MAEREGVTLVHDTAKPSPIVAYKPGTITQLRSQGYRVVDANEDVPVGYEAQTKESLQDTIRARNAAPGDQEHLPVSGTKPELIAVLTEADQTAQTPEPDAPQEPPA